MIRIHRTFHDPVRLRDALANAAQVVLDLETTGLLRHDRIVAVGALIDRDAHILVTEEHRDVSSTRIRINRHDLLDALAPLSQRRDLVAVFHNAAFDLAMLERAGVPVGCRVHDTLKLLKLWDSDRGREFADDAGAGSRNPRIDHRFSEPLNYKLKDVAKHLLNVAPREYPGEVSILGLPELVRYLKSDLLVTRTLYDRVWSRLAMDDRGYHESLIVPITSMLVNMTVLGVHADAAFVDAESQRLLDLMASISSLHEKRFGQRLDAGDFALRGWVYYHGLRCHRIRSGKKRELSLRTEHLMELMRSEDSPKTRESLSLLHDYKLAQSLMIRLRSLGEHVDRSTSRIYSTFNDSQASGRVSSTRPNLQQIAREVGPDQKKRFVSDSFFKTVIKSRNAIVASPGCELVGFDIAQADIRVLAHAVESFGIRGEKYLKRLEKKRLRRLWKHTSQFQLRMWDYFQPRNRKPVKCPNCWTQFEVTREARGSSMRCPHCTATVDIPSWYPDFDPTKGCELADDFRNSTADFYTTASERMLGRKPQKGTSERDHLKQTILGMVNGMGAGTLAKRLNVSHAEAKRYIEVFAKAYPQVAAFTDLMHHRFAVTGIARTFAGRRRRLTAHWWLVTKPVVEIFISYKRADKLWLKVVPLQANHRTLTCWVLRAVDAKRGSPNENCEIYNHKAGRISQAPYRFFEDQAMVFRLPVRNVSWRLIRRVRTEKEEAVYEGFDKACRQLFNHICQGGTADITKTMMLRAEPVCEQFGGRMILQIHDELVFEVPKGKAVAFARVMKKTLEQPPTPDFMVPIVVEPMIGSRFGEMRKLPPEMPPSPWWHRLWCWLRDWWSWLRSWLPRRR